jgi:lysozyme
MQMAGDMNAVVDLSHWDGDIALDKARDAGIRGVINKATQGFRFVDPTFATNRTKTTAAGLLWGAYHFGVGGDPIAQADFFLSTVEPDNNTLLVLDFEHNATGSSMSLDEAREFVTYLQQKVARWPVLYAGSYLKEQLSGAKESILSNCALWIAQYAPTPILPAGWDQWTLWQYTDGAHGEQPHAVDGIGRCDRNYFRGDDAALAAFWKSSAA